MRTEDGCKTYLGSLNSSLSSSGGGVGVSFSGRKFVHDDTVVSISRWVYYYDAGTRYYRSRGLAPYLIIFVV